MPRVTPPRDADGYFGEEVAARYDEDESDESDAEALELEVDFLAQLAGNGRALEFGIGTGRVALPLARRGVSVSGIELSRAMAARIPVKAGGDAIDVVIGDFSTTRSRGEFDLVYLVFNTIMNVTTQAGQVAVFENAATHLRAGGCFVIEVMVPQLRVLPPGKSTVVFSSTDSHVGIDEYDVANQGLVSHHFTLRDGQWGHASVPFRYAYPAEYDLMAQLVGLRLRERWEDWQRRPFTSESEKHVSVWEKA